MYITGDLSEAKPDYSEQCSDPARWVQPQPMQMAEMSRSQRQQSCEISPRDHVDACTLGRSPPRWCSRAEFS